MTTQEQQMLQGLTDRVNQTQLPEKNADAEDFIQQNLARNPDALYILAQTVLVQQYALDQAQKQLADARAQLQQAQQQPRHSGSFLGNLLGMNDDRPEPPPPPQPQYTQVPNYAPPPPQYGAPQYYPAPQQGGFLRSAMHTATGVAAGALAFEGIESLMHGFGHAAGYGQDFGGGYGGGFSSGRPEEIVNNYYGDAAPGHDSNLSPDIEDRRGDNFADPAGAQDYGDDSNDNTADPAGAQDYGDDSNDSGSSDDFSGGGDFGGSDDSGN
jgi:hypothetical protein